MKLSQSLKFASLAGFAMMLSNCASFQSANQVADYNGDGVVSNAEYVQFNKQKNVEDRNVYSESVKRRNVVNTVGDVNDTIWNARSAVWGLKHFP